MYNKKGSTRFRVGSCIIEKNIPFAFDMRMDRLATQENTTSQQR